MILVGATTACGEGLYTTPFESDAGGAERDAEDAVTEGDAPAPTSSDARDGGASADGSPDAEVVLHSCQRVDFQGAQVILAGEARLNIGLNALRTPTEVCLLRAAPSERRPPLERSYEILLINGATRFSEPPLLEILNVVAPSTVPFERLSLAYLQREATTPEPTSWWIPISDSRVTNATAASVTGRLHSLTDQRRIAVALVVVCSTMAHCPTGSSCRSGACQ